MTNLLLLLCLTCAFEVPKAPVPKSPYLPVVYRYADAMLERGKINPEQDQNFLRLLYTLSELSGKPKYRDAADAELKKFATNAIQEFSRPWLLWDRCFELAPAESKRFALDLTKRTPASERQAGFYIRTWAVAYAHTRDEQFLNAIASTLERFESKGALSLAIDCDGAAHRVPEPLASRLRAFAAQQRPPSLITPQTAMMCVSRYDNTGNPAFRDVILRAADAAPGNESPGLAVSLQVAAWRHSAKPEYLERARKFADLAVEKYWGTNALPRVAAGSDTLALALVELHLHILHITAVRCPPNTIDR